MHPSSVGVAAWVFASAPSKVPFYLAGGLLVAWAVLLGAFGVTHPDFPGSRQRARLVMLTSAVLVAAAVVTSVVTAGEEGPSEAAAARPTGSAAPTSALNLSADPTGKLAYDKKTATVRPGRVAVRLVNNSSQPHNITIAKGTKVISATKTVTGGNATTTANLPAGNYVFYCSVDEHRAAGMHGTLTVK